MFEITFSLTNLKVYKYYNRKMSNLVTVSPKLFFNFPFSIRNTYLPVHCRLSAPSSTQRKQSMAMGLLKPKEKTCRSHTNSYFPFEYKHTI